MKETIEEKIKEAVKSAGYSLPANFSILTPPRPEMGDYATNIAMVIKSEENPSEVAKKVAAILEKNKEFSKIEIAGPGFINIYFSSDIYKEELKEIIKDGDNYGKGKKKKEKVSVEYVSANPTGPLHVGNARGGPIGETIANLLEFIGHEVEREFYVNDMGLQIERFGRSLYYWFAVKSDTKMVFPEDGYHAEYVKEISEQIQEEKAEELSRLHNEPEIVELFIREGLCHTIKSIREDCELIGIKFDKWFYESDLVHSGETEKIVNQLKEKDFTTNKEGALWFKNPDDPEFKDQESVLIKSDGNPTYFADDIAYHINKFGRGFDLLIDIWGANHHGHLPRFLAALKALGCPEEKIKVLFYQYIRLKNEGQTFRMEKRGGNIVTLRQVIESGVEPDAFKYFIISQNPNTPFDFDLALAADTSEKNPVFYIKYAHARICSILKKVEKGSEEDWDFADLKDPKEAALYKELVKFKEIINSASTDFQIQALPHYAYKIAGLFHDFYSSCPVLESSLKVKKARIALILATKTIIANTLAICAIEAPEKM